MFSNDADDHAHIDAGFTRSNGPKNKRLEWITFKQPDNTREFISCSSAAAFDRIDMREISGTKDNEMFGNFVSSTTALARCPDAEPLL